MNDEQFRQLMDVLRDIRFIVALGFVIAILTIAFGFYGANAVAAYRPAVATQDEAAITCGDPQDRAAALEWAKQMPGLRRVRINAIQNMNPLFRCDPIAAARAVKAAGFEPFVTVIGTAGYARQLDRAIGGIVNLWSVWNEPNLDGWQVGAMTNGTPIKYHRLFRVVARTLRKHDPGSKVLIGELAPHHDLTYMSKVVSQRSTYKRPLRADGIAVHAYRWYERPESKNTSGMRGYLTAWRKAARRWARERRLCRPGLSGTVHRLAYDGRQKRKHTLKRSSCRPVPIYVTEAGYLRQFRGDHVIYSTAQTASRLVRSWRVACKQKVKQMMHYQLVDNRQPEWDTALIGEWGPRPEFGALTGYLRKVKGCKGKAGRLGREFGPPPPVFLPDVVPHEVISPSLPPVAPGVPADIPLVVPPAQVTPPVPVPVPEPLPIPPVPQPDPTPEVPAVVPPPVAPPEPTPEPPTPDPLPIPVPEPIPEVPPVVEPPTEEPTP